MTNKMDGLTKLTATFFGVGYIRFIPATWASAAAAVLAWFIYPVLIYVAVVFVAAGFWACRNARRVFQSKDPGPFVMDEVCGMMLSVLFLPKTIPVFAVAFILFRIFDAWKPGPIRTLDKLEHPSGILLDDLLAGVATNVTLQAALAVWGRPL